MTTPKPLTGKYAVDTEVPVSKTKTEIEAILIKYGASGFMYGWQSDKAIIGFQIKNRNVRFELPLPTDQEVKFTPSGILRTKSQRDNAKDKATRQRWRSILLIIKAKLEAVETGIVTLENEFLANTVMPNGSTIGELVGMQLDKALESGQLPPLLQLPPPTGLKN